jgi:hypothetical protein
MAIDPVDAFLADKQPRQSTFLSGLDRSISSNKQARRAAQQAGRAQNTIAAGRGKLAGLGGGMNPQSFLNPQPVGATLPGAPTGQLALPPGGGAGVPARVMAGGQQGVPGGGPAALGAGGGEVAIPGAGRIQATHIPSNARGLPAGAARAGAGAADDIAAQALGAGGRTGAAAKINQAGKAAGGFSRAANAQATANTASGMLSGGGASKIFANVTRQSMMKGAGVAGTGYMLSGLVDSMDIGGENGVVDRAGSAGILGGSLAAGGAIALGVPHVAAAAAGGAILFGGYKALFGDDRTTPEQMQDTVNDTKDTITSIASMYGLGPDATEEIMMQFDASTSLMIGQKDKAGLKNYLTGLTNQLPAMMLQQKDQADAQGQEEQRYERMMQMQAQFAPMFERQMQTSNASSERAFNQQMSVSDVLVDRQPQLAALIKTSAANDNAAQGRLMTAYAKQIAMGPASANDTTELQRRIEQEQLLNQYIG